MIFLGIWTLLSPDRPPAAKANYTDFPRHGGSGSSTNEPHVEKVTIKEGDYIFVVKNPAKNMPPRRSVAEGPREVDPALIENAAQKQGHGGLREGRELAAVVGRARHHCAHGAAVGHVLPVHAPTPGRRRQGDELWQVAGPHAQRVGEQGHIRRCGRRGRGQGRGRGDHRVSQRPEEVSATRWANPQGRAHGGAAGNR